LKNLILLLLVASALGQSPATITGVVQGTNGVAATSGLVEFDITPQNSSTNYSIIGSTILAPQKGTCGIDALGNVKSLDLTGPCRVWGNDNITPANTLYKIIIAPNGAVSATLNNILIAGSSTDLSNLTAIAPQPVIGTVINASPLITQGVVPSNDAAWPIGQPNKAYTGIFAHTLQLVGLGPVRLFGPIGLTPTPVPFGFSGYSFDASGNPVVSINGGAYQPLQIGLLAVLSVFGRTGAVIAQAGDYNVSQVTGAAPVASPTFTGIPAGPTAVQDTNTTQFATTAFVLGQAASATPLIEGTAAAGTSTRYARADHVHPVSNPVYNHSGAIQTTPHTVIDSGTLAGGTLTVTFTGSAVYTSLSSYVCVPIDTTALNPMDVTYTSGSVVVFNGTGTDTFRYVCTGN
jgi:hypothetical protein